MTSSTSNQAALQSQIYNPNYDDIDLGLYNIISNNMSDDTYQELLKKYTNMFYNMSKTNEYEGVFQNPFECSSQEFNNDLNDILNDISSTYPNSSYTDPEDPNSLISIITGGNSTTSTVSQDDVLTIPDNAVIDTNSDGTYSVTTYTNPTAIQPSITSANNYFNTVVGNFPLLMALAQTAMGLLTALLNSGNPCSALGNFFGSIMSVVQGVISNITAYIKEILSYIASGLAAAISEVTSLLQKVQQEIQTLMAQIKKEIANFIKALIDSIRAGLGSFLKGLLNDPCASSLIKSISTPSALFLL